MNQKDIQTDTKLRFYVAHDELFIDLILYQFGWEQCSPLHQFGPAKRNHFLFHYVLSGKGRLETNDQTYYLGAHQGFLLCPDQISSYYADPDDPWKYVWLEFDGLRARECMKLAGLSEHQPVYTPVSADNTAVPERMLQIVDSHEKSPIHLIGLGMLFMDELVSTSKTKVTETRRKLRDSTCVNPSPTLKATTSGIFPLRRLPMSAVSTAVISAACSRRPSESLLRHF